MKRHRRLKPYKVISIVGARPQFIKMALVSEALKGEKRYLREISVHTGQHYDYEMSSIFFEELKLRRPEYCLNIGSASHGAQTGKMLSGIEKILLKERPDLVLVYGDTNTTLAGALAAVKLCIPIAHIEAGLRSDNWRMPEEINRILTDRISTLFFCPTAYAVQNLAKEGIRKNVYQVGDVMIDMLRRFEPVAEQRSTILKRLHLLPNGYYLATLHRPVNADQAGILRRLLTLFKKLDFPVVFPVHPRTQKQISHLQLAPSSSLKLLEPVSYCDMILLEKYARAIVTDSGGVQKEAYHFRVPCVTLREETEWVETVQSGWNRLAGNDPRKVLNSLQGLHEGEKANHLFGNGQASQKIACRIRAFLEEKRNRRKF